MYGKIFASLYQGTLRGMRDEIAVFTNMLAHSDADGIVDMHFRAIAEETGLGIDEVKAAIVNLESPDPESRSPEEEGRRIVRVSEHRIWGWRIVNHAKYREIRSESDRREKNRVKIANHRAKLRANKAKSVTVTVTGGNQPVTTCNQPVTVVLPNVTDVAHTDTETDTHAEGKDICTEPGRPAPVRANAGTNPVTPVPKTKKPRKPTIRDPLFDAICEVTGSLPNSNAPRVSQTVTAFLGETPPITPDEIREFGRRFHEICPWAAKSPVRNQPTLGELQNHVGKIRTAPGAIKPRPNDRLGRVDTPEGKYDGFDEDGSIFGLPPDQD